MSKNGPSERLRLALSLAAAMAIGGFFLWLASRAIPLSDVRDFVQGLDRAAWARLGLVSVGFLGLYGICHGARVVRWYFLVRSLGECDAARVHRACTVGFLAVVLLPFRLGELVRPFLLMRTTPISGSGALGTVVVERVVDGLLVTGVLFLALWTYSGEASTEAVRAWGTLAALIFVPAMGMALLGYFQREVARRLLMATAGRVVPGIAEKAWGMLDQFCEGVAGLVRRHDLIPFAALTALYWGSNVAAMWFLGWFGFGLQVGPLEMITVLVVLVVGLMVPSGPAMAGNFEYFAAQGMGLYVPLQDASISGAVGAFAALLHLLQLVVIVVPGVWLLLRYRELRFGGDTLREAREMAKN